MERLLKVSQLTPRGDYSARLLVLREALNERRHALIYQAYSDPTLAAPHISRMVSLARNICE